MRFKGLVILSLVVFSILSLAYAYGPRFAPGTCPNCSTTLEQVKVIGTVEKIYYDPGLTIDVKTTKGETITVRIGAYWLQNKLNLKVGSKVEIDGFKSAVTNVIRALKVSVDGKQLLDLTSQSNQGIGRRQGFGRRW